MLTLTESAISQVKTLLEEENEPMMLRVFIQGGGCSGFSYGFTFDTEQGEEDWLWDFDGVPVLCDVMSATYLEGAIVDYKSGLFGSAFSIENPNAKATCGCGSSFAV